MSEEVRIRYWYQRTLESGSWCVSGLMSVAAAKKLVTSDVYPQATIVQDEEGWPPYEEPQPCR